VKARKPSSIALSFVFLLLYVVVGFVLWRFGFLPPDQSFMERAVTVSFLFMICFSPLGILSALSLTRSARKQDAGHDRQKAQELRKRRLQYLMRSFAEAALGILGYYLVSRRVFPQIDVIWIFSALILPPALLQIWFRLRWNSLKQQQLRNQMPTQGS
jgi:hypothetical protein